MTEKWFHDETDIECTTLQELDVDRKKAIRANYESICRRVDEVKKANGISRDVKIVAATKNVDVAAINYAHTLGLNCIGENRVQEFTDKFNLLDADIEKHFIGKLQRNKVKYIVGRASLIHSLDGVQLAEEISLRALKKDVVQDVLVEVNIGREENKGGVMPEDLESFLNEVKKNDGIRLCGLMTIAPVCVEKEEYRSFFRKTYQILLDTFAKKIHNIGEPILSMGMSSNFDIAVECGANIIRPGTAIFGSRVKL